MMNKNVLFALFGTAGAFLGSLVGVAVARNNGLLLPFWSMSIAIGLAFGFTLAQSRYLKGGLGLSPQFLESLRRVAIGGVLAGIAFILGNLLLGRFLAWILEAAVIAVALARVIPNLPRKWLILAGGLAGAVGFVSLPVFQLLGDEIGVAIGDSFKGLLLGLALSYVESLTRKIWIELRYSNGNRKLINIGAEPVRIGAGKDSDVFVLGYPETVTYVVEDGKAFRSSTAGGERVLVRDGDTTRIPDNMHGDIEVVVCMK